jgi:hypothetical protein
MSICGDILSWFGVAVDVDKDEEADTILERLAEFRIECDIVIQMHSSHPTIREHFEAEKLRIDDLTARVLISKYDHREVNIRKEVTSFLNARVPIDGKLVDSFNAANLEAAIHSKTLRDDVHPYSIYTADPGKQQAPISEEASLSRSIPSAPTTQATLTAAPTTGMNTEPKKEKLFRLKA